MRKSKALQKSEEYLKEPQQRSSVAKMFPTILKVFCVHSDPNYTLPWQMNKQFSSSSTGFIINNRLILTNAHSVENFSQVKVRRRGVPAKYIAKVVAIGRDCDMALLTVDDETFWKDAPFIDLEELQKNGKMLPKLEEKVSVVGFPVGGENLSVTSGIVSRIDMQQYTMGDHELLAVQVDAAINPGNSGGPVFDYQTNFIGIAFQGLKEAENIGYIIPLPVVYHFLEDVQRNGVYSGFCTLGIGLQKEFLGLDPDQGGLLVGKVPILSAAQGLIYEGDVVLEVDGLPIASDGTIEFPSNWTYGKVLHRNIESDDIDENLDFNSDNWVDEQRQLDETLDGLERIDLSFLISQKFVGDTCKLKILRSPNSIPQSTAQGIPPNHSSFSQAIKQPIDMSIPDSFSASPRPLASTVVIRLEEKTNLIAREGTRVKLGSPYLRLPSYYVVSGLVFVPLTEMYFIAEYGDEFDEEAPIQLLNLWLNVEKRFKDEQVVIISQVLANNDNSGYEYLQNIRLVKVNGMEVLNLQHLASVIDGILRNGVHATEKRYLRFEFAGGFSAVFDIKSVLKNGNNVLTQHGVPSAKSDDIK